LEELKLNEIEIPEKDLEIRTCRGSGDGGQKRNKTESAVVVTYLPTNISVRCEAERSQYQNKQLALYLLKAKLINDNNYKTLNNANNIRKQQIGSGMRGDKRRTVRCQHNVVVDHITNKKWTLDEYLSGKW
jgi:peptide chain release factor 1